MREKYKKALMITFVVLVMNVVNLSAGTLVQAHLPLLNRSYLTFICICYKIRR